MSARVTGSGRIGAGAPSGPASGLGWRTLPGLALWYRGDLHTGFNADAVASHGDQSRTGDAEKTATQPDPGAQPTYIASDPAYASRPADAYDGSADFMDTGTWSVSVTQPNMVYIVGNVAASGALQHFFDGPNYEGPTRQLIRYRDDTNVFEVYAGTLLTSTTTLAPRSPAIMCVAFDGVSTAFYVNTSTAPLMTGDAGTNGLNRVCLGINAGLGSGWLGGKIAEFAVCSGRHSTDVIARAFRSAGVRYGKAWG